MNETLRGLYPRFLWWHHFGGFSKFSDSFALRIYQRGGDYFGLLWISSLQRGPCAWVVGQKCLSAFLKRKLRHTLIWHMNVRFLCLKCARHFWVEFYSAILLLKFLARSDDLLLDHNVVSKGELAWMNGSEAARLMRNDKRFVLMHSAR